MIRKEIGDKKGEAVCFANLGSVYHSLGEYGKAVTYQKNALVILKEIGYKKGEAETYRNLGTLFRSVGKYAKAREYHEKALAVNREISHRRRGSLASRPCIRWHIRRKRKLAR